MAPGTRFTRGLLVKAGAGTLDLTGAVLANDGLEIREGAVRLSADGAGLVTARQVRFNVTKTRPGKAGPPEYADSGSQFSEFNLYLGGEKLPWPASATAVGDTGYREGPAKGIDGDVKTKCYHRPLVVDFGTDLAFDGYSFTTANDAIGRDPVSWKVEVSGAPGAHVPWTCVGAVTDFATPKARFTPVGKVFPVVSRDVVPPNYPVNVEGKGCLVLSGGNETLEAVTGGGLIHLENGASVVFAKGATFSGTILGGTVSGGN